VARAPLRLVVVEIFKRDYKHEKLYYLYPKGIQVYQKIFLFLSYIGVLNSI